MDLDTSVFRLIKGRTAVRQTEVDLINHYTKDAKKMHTKAHYLLFYLIFSKL